LQSRSEGEMRAIMSLAINCHNNYLKKKLQSQNESLQKIPNLTKARSRVYFHLSFLAPMELVEMRNRKGILGVFPQRSAPINDQSKWNVPWKTFSLFLCVSFLSKWEAQAGLVWNNNKPLDENYDHRILLFVFALQIFGPGSWMKEFPSSPSWSLFTSEGEEEGGNGMGLPGILDSFEHLLPPAPTRSPGYLLRRPFRLPELWYWKSRQVDYLEEKSV